MALQRGGRLVSVRRRAPAGCCAAAAAALLLALSALAPRCCCAASDGGAHVQAQNRVHIEAQAAQAVRARVAIEAAGGVGTRQQAEVRFVDAATAHCARDAAIPMSRLVMRSLSMALETYAAPEHAVCYAGSCSGDRLGLHVCKYGTPKLCSGALPKPRMDELTHPVSRWALH